MDPIDPTSFPADPYRTPPVADATDPRALPYTGQSRMVLSIGSGLAGARLVIDPGASALIRVDTGDDRAPRLRVDGEVIRLGWPPSFAGWMRLWLAGARPEVAIVLHPAVEWTLQIRGGVSDLRADLTAGRVAAIDVTGGCSDVALDLPRPQRTTSIRVTGGASGVRLRRPADVGVSVTIDGGVAGLRLDDQHFQAIGGAARLHAAGVAPGVPGYELSVPGGAAFVEVERAR